MTGNTFEQVLAVADEACDALHHGQGVVNEGVINL